MARKVLKPAIRLTAALIAATAFTFSCSSDGPIVVRDPNPVIVESATTIAQEEKPSASAGASDSTSGPSPKVTTSGGSALILLAGGPMPITGWTPWDHVCSWSCRNVLDQVLETLAIVLPDGSTAPLLAEQIEPNPSMLNWTVTLRRDLNFSDGRPVTANVIKDGYEEFLKRGEVTRGLLRDARINAIKVLDEYQLMIDLSEPNPSIDVVLAGPLGRVFSVEAARNDPAAFLRSPVGTGPFVMQPWQPDTPIRLTANRDYWRTGSNGDPLPLLDDITFEEVQDEQTRVEKVRMGEADFAQTRSALAIENARDSELIVVSRSEDNVGVILFNTIRPPIDDVRVRRALQLASSQNELIEASAGAGAGEPATQWFAPESRWWSGLAAELWPAQDTAKAKELLEQYINDGKRSDKKQPGDKISLDLQCTDDIHLDAMIRELAEQWESTGLIDVNEETITRSGLIQRVLGSVTDRPGFSGDFMATCWRVGGESDPAMMFESLFGPIRTSPLNVTNLHNETLTGFVDLLHSSSVETVRQAAVEQLMLTFVEQMPMIYLSHTESALIGHKGTEGLGSWSLPDGRQMFGQVAGVGRWAEVRVSDE